MKLTTKNTPKMSKTGRSAAIRTQSWPFCGRDLKTFARLLFLPPPPHLYLPLK